MRTTLYRVNESVWNTVIVNVYSTSSPFVVARPKPGVHENDLWLLKIPAISVGHITSKLQRDFLFLSVAYIGTPKLPPSRLNRP